MKIVSAGAVRRRGRARSQAGFAQFVDDVAIARAAYLARVEAALVRGVSESLAGRVEFVELSGFGLAEVGSARWKRLWLRGGWRRRRAARGFLRDASKSFRTSFSATPRRLSCRATSLLRMPYSSRLSSIGSVISGLGKKIPARRPCRVTRIGVLERRSPVAWSQNSRTELILMWSLQCHCRCQPPLQHPHGPQGIARVFLTSAMGAVPSLKLPAINVTRDGG